MSEPYEAIRHHGKIVDEWISYCNVHHRKETVYSVPYVVCFECGHVYEDEQDLCRRYRQLAKLSPPKLALRSDDFDRMNVWRWLRWHWKVMTITGEKIQFCQECLHDF